jgi:hypothetical protein
MGGAIVAEIGVRPERRLRRESIWYDRTAYRCCHLDFRWTEKGLGVLPSQPPGSKHGPPLSHRHAAPRLADERKRRLWPRAMFTGFCARPMTEVDPERWFA